MKILMFVGGVILFMMIEEESGAHIGNFLWGGGLIYHQSPKMA